MLRVVILDKQAGEVEARGDGIGLEGTREGEGKIVGLGLMDWEGIGELHTSTRSHGSVIHWISG